MPGWKLTGKKTTKKKFDIKLSVKKRSGTAGQIT
jgi:hypothetical protein